MKTLRLALPTKGDRGMKDMISDIFARAATFTIIDIVEGEVKEVRVEENKASGLKQGTGPIVARDLKEKGVDVVIAGELGPGAKTLLDMSGITMVRVSPGVKVKEAVAEALNQLLQPTEQL
jgi:predicted Fe-Mo cluster-binding NifX family protein